MMGHCGPTVIIENISVSKWCQIWPSDWYHSIVYHRIRTYHTFSGWIRHSWQCPDTFWYRHAAIALHRCVPNIFHCIPRSNCVYSHSKKVCVCEMNAHLLYGPPTPQVQSSLPHKTYLSPPSPFPSPSPKAETSCWLVNGDLTPCECKFFLVSRCVNRMVVPQGMGSANWHEVSLWNSPFWEWCAGRTIQRVLCVPGSFTNVTTNYREKERVRRCGKWHDKQ